MTVRLFTERYYWRCSTAVVACIFSTLLLGHPLRQWWDHQDGHALAFLLAMALIGGCVLLGGFKLVDRWELWAVRLGLSGVLVMFFLRLSLTERSHIIEYSVLTYCVYQALTIRYDQKWTPFQIGLSTFLVCTLLGFLDEGIQTLLPQRIGSWEDIVFDVGAVIFTISSLSFFGAIRRRIKTNL